VLRLYPTHLAHEILIQSFSDRLLSDINIQESDRRHHDGWTGRESFAPEPGLCMSFDLVMQEAALCRKKNRNRSRLAQFHEGVD
jgi:hypothetical protein